MLKKFTLLRRIIPPLILLTTKNLSEKSGMGLLNLHCTMKKFFLGLFIAVFMIPLKGHSQNSPQHRGLYIDGFEAIISSGDQEIEELLNYLEANNFNTITLYDLSHINYQNATETNKLASFISAARQRGVTSVAAASEIVSFFEDKIIPYNHTHQSNERFDVLNFEFEFWVPDWYEYGGIYCNKYLSPNGYACSEAGAFNFFMDQLTQIYQLAQEEGLETEIYLGWFSQSQINQMIDYTDRIILHAYRKTPASTFAYSKGRLEYIENTHQPVEIVALFSSEPAFMHNWLVENNADLPLVYQTYHNDLMQNRNWHYIDVQGYHWFTYSSMPKIELSVPNETPEEPTPPQPEPDLDLSIAPNPTSGNVQVLGNSDWVNRIIILNLYRNIVMDFSFQKQFSVASLNQGIYIVKFIGNHGLSQTTFIIKR